MENPGGLISTHTPVCEEPRDAWIDGLVARATPTSASQLSQEAGTERVSTQLVVPHFLSTVQGH